MRWDIAMCQSILETGNFTFKGSSVKPEFNNFAGIGATDTDPVPERYTTADLGVKAQIQILAIRAGVEIPKDDMLSMRYRKYYDLVFNKARYWHQLAGTWASDKHYWDKIVRLCKELEKSINERVLVNDESTNDAPVITPVEGVKMVKKEDVTWLEMNRDDEGNPAVTAYAGAQPAFTRRSAYKSDVQEFFDTFPNAKTVLVADTHTKNIPDMPDYADVVEPRPGVGESGKKLEYIPFAKQYGNIPTKGFYPNKHPRGATIHHTAGHQDDGKNTVEYLAKQPYPCLVIAKDGTVLQAFPLSKWGWHDGTSHSRIAVGIEVCSGGKLEGGPGNYKTGFDKKVADENVRIIEKQNGSQQPGAYEKWTQAQFDSLVKTLCWLKYNAPDVFDFDLIKGHDEVAPHRKNDPGGSMAMNMADFRDHVKQTYIKIYGGDMAPEPTEYPVWKGVKSFTKGLNLKLSPNFHLSEFDCKCSNCAVTKVDYAHLKKLQEFRDEIGKPIKITSGYRCPYHNPAVGGVTNSQHLLGTATDIIVPGVSAATITEKADAAEFKGVGAYSNFTHVDSRTGAKARWAG